jgi:hypothetical protein
LRGLDQTETQGLLTTQRRLDDKLHWKSLSEKTRDGATFTGRMFRKPMEGLIPHAELFSAVH